MRVPLNAALVEAISVVPSVVALRRRDGGGFRPVELLVLCRAGAQLGKVSLAEGPPGVEIDDLGAPSLGRRRVRLSVHGDVGHWPDNSDVWLTAGGRMLFGLKVSKPSS